MRVIKDNRASLPWALNTFDEMREKAGDRKIALFLDYDGTLTPIVDSPEKAVLSTGMRRIITALSKLCMVAIISGRDLADIRNTVGIDGIYYAGSHGFDITGPGIDKVRYQEGTEYLPLLDRVEGNLNRMFSGMEGIFIERKKFSIAVHYRKAVDEDIEKVSSDIDDLLKEQSGLRKSSGKKIFEIQPDIQWNKGRALFWLLKTLDMKDSDTFPLYIGDDNTDEDAFRAVKGKGLGIVVMEQMRKTEADEMLHDTGEVETYLQRLTKVLNQN